MLPACMHCCCSCPGEQLVDVAFRMTPAQPSLHIFWSDLVGYAFAAFAFSFLFISLGLGIFKCVFCSLWRSPRAFSCPPGRTHPHVSSLHPLA